MRPYLNLIIVNKGNSETQSSDYLGRLDVGKLIIKQSLPASIGFLVMSIYSIVDTIYVGRLIGPLAIAAVTVVTPISFMISSIGMAIGIGGSSVISRALGSGDSKKAHKTFGNQINLTFHMASILVLGGYFFRDEVLIAFGGKGDILEPAAEYFKILLVGVPFLAWAMMSNSVIRAQGRPKIAMMVMIIPSITNIILDPILMIGFDMGLAGAAWATTISQISSALFTLYFFLSGKSEISIVFRYFKLKWDIVNEIASIGFITLARQGTISLLTVVLNHTLFTYAGEEGITVWGIVNRVMMFALFPVIGITQGFLPIAGYNYGAGLAERVKKSIYTSIWYSALMAGVVLIIIIVFSESVVWAFTDEKDLIEKSAYALIIVFAASPLMSVQMIGSGYFQAIGRAKPALFLTIFKQAFFLIPMVLVMPKFFDLNGIWVSFPISDVFATIFIWFYLKKKIRLIPGRK